MEIIENTPPLSGDLNSELLPGLHLSAETQQEISAFFVTLPQNQPWEAPILAASPRESQPSPAVFTSNGVWGYPELTDTG